MPSAVLSDGGVIGGCYETLIEMLPDAVCVFENDVLVFANEAAARIFGAPGPQALIGWSVRDFVAERDLERVDARLANLRAGLSNPPMVIEGRRFDGRPVRIETTSAPVRRDGVTIGAILIARDVSAEDRRAQLISGQARILEMSARGLAMPGTLDAVVRLTERLCPDMSCSIMLLSPDGKHLLAGAASSLPPAYAAAIDGCAIGPNVGSCGSAAHSRSPVLAEDIANDPRWAGCRRAALRHGLLACWSTPVFASDGSVAATFACYFKSTRGPDDSERAIVATLTGLATLVIERDRTDRRLLAMQAKLLAAQRMAHLGNWEMDIAADRVTASPMVREILGMDLQHETFSGTQMRHAFHPDDRDKLTAHGHRAIRHGTPIDLVSRVLRADGTLRWVELRGEALRESGSAATRFTGVLQDVTHRVEASQAVRLQQAAIASISEGIVICDAQAADLPMVYVNTAVEAMTGYSAAELLGRNCRMFQADAANEPGLAEIRAAIAGQRQGQAVLTNLRKDGTRFWNDLRISPVRDEAGVVTHYVGVMADVSEAVLHQHQLAHQASHDALTALPNRQLLERRLEAALATARRTGATVGVAFVDLDNFKAFNDSIGHAAGDAVLRTVAGRLENCVRDGDTVARIGGDEFVLVLEGLGDADRLAEVGARVMQALALPIELDGRDHAATASIGLAAFPRDGSTVGELIKRADFAMYKAKEDGRGVVRAYAPAFDKRGGDRLNLAWALRKALERNEFVLHFQPKCATVGGAVRGLEALVRWMHPQRGLVPPLEFIALAEQTGVIVQLGQWVLEQACRQNKAWHDRGVSDFPVSVNVSAIQFKQPDFIDVVERALAASGLAPQGLDLEITESALMDDPEQFVRTLHSLKALGVTVSLDDFGTGYSSLSYLKRFPIDRLKIDRSFVRDITEDPADAAICGAIVAMAHNLGLAVVAEGVENAAQAQFLEDKGCDELQGYLFSRPLAAEAIEAWLLGRRPADAAATDTPAARAIRTVPC